MSDVSRRHFLKVATSTVAGVVGAGLAVSAAEGRLSNEDIIRAWKDEGFRNSLTPGQRAQLPTHPSGSIEIEDQDLDETILVRSRNKGSNGRCCG